MSTILHGIAPIRHEGMASTNPLAFRHFDPIGRMDACAPGLLVAAAMIEEGALADSVRERYAGWQATRGRDMLASKVSLTDLSAQVLAEDRAVAPRSGRQARFENIVLRFL